MSVPNAFSLDHYLENTKIGIYHYRIMVLCGLSFMADGMEVNLLSFLSICSAGEWNLSNTAAASVASAVFVGVIAGCWFFGFTADRFGRRPTFLVSAGLISTFGLLTSFATSFYWLLIIRFLVGFGIGGASVPFDLLAEFLPASNRGSFLVFVEYFWTFGSMYVAACAWLTLSQTSWRVLAAITALPIAITSVLSIWFLPESPRWLLSQGRVEEAEKAVLTSYIANGHTETVIKLIADPTEHDTATALTTPVNFHQPKIEDSYLDIIRNPILRRSTLPLWTVWTVFGFTYYGLVLLINRIYIRSSSTPSGCNFDYSSIFVNSASEVVGITIAILLIKHLGPIWSQVLYYFLSAVATLLLGLTTEPMWVLFVAFLARVMIMAASTCTWVITPELYPTKMRSFAHAVCVSWSKIGSFFSPYLVLSSFSVSSVAIFLAILNLIAVFAALCLLNTDSKMTESKDVQVEEAVRPRNSSIIKMYGEHVYEMIHNKEQRPTTNLQQAVVNNVLHDDNHHFEEARR